MKLRSGDPLETEDAIVQRCGTFFGLLHVARGDNRKRKQARGVVHTRVSREYIRSTHE